MESQNSTSLGFKKIFTQWLNVVPPAFSAASLATCVALPEAARAFGREWATSWPAKSLYLYGPYGSGKTTFAFALIREFIRHWTPSRYVWPAYLSARSLDQQLLNAVRNEGDSWLLERYSTDDMLFIDDIDKVVPTDRFKSQFFEIINNRYNEMLPTILTSNCDLMELAGLFEGAIVSRMQDTKLWHIIKFPDKDLRRSIT